MLHVNHGLVVKVFDDKIIGGQTQGRGDVNTADPDFSSPFFGNQTGDFGDGIVLHRRHKEQSNYR